MARAVVADDGHSFTALNVQGEDYRARREAGFVLQHVADRAESCLASPLKCTAATASTSSTRWVRRLASIATLVSLTPLSGISGPGVKAHVRRSQPGCICREVVGLLLGLEFCGHASPVVLDLPVHGGRVPAEQRGDELGDLRRRGYAPIPRLDRDPGTAGQDVIEVESSFGLDRVQGFDLQVTSRGAQRLTQLGVFLDELEELMDERAVPAQQVLDPDLVEPTAFSQERTSVPVGVEAFGSQQRNLLRAGRRDVPRKPVG